MLLTYRLSKPMERFLLITFLYVLNVLCHKMFLAICFRMPLKILTNVAVITIITRSTFAVVFIDQNTMTSCSVLTWVRNTCIWFWKVITCWSISIILKQLTQYPTYVVMQYPTYFWTRILILWKYTLVDYQICCARKLVCCTQKVYKLLP